MHKKRNGFTLIELLVTLALIISILTLAVTSVIKISDKQKENAFEKVKEQVIVAAEQYFESNEYLFENLPETGFGIIPVGKLVEDDYLNKLTNPITGMPLNECDKVKVQRNSSGKYEMTYIGAGNEICFSTNNVSVQSNPNAPSLELKFVRSNGTNKTYIEDAALSDYWINYNELNNDSNVNNNYQVHVEIKTSASKENIQYCNTNAEICSGQNITNFNDGELSGENTIFYDTISYSNDTSQKQVCYVATNSDGYRAKCINVGVDTKKPNVEIMLSEKSNFTEIYELIKEDEITKEKKDNWTKNDVYYKYKGNDVHDGKNGSGIKSVQIRENATGITKKEINSSKYTWTGTGYPKLGPYANFNLSSPCQYDQGKGHRFKEDGVRRVRYVVCDVAGNCNSEVEATAYIDKTAPELELTLPNTSDETKWYSVTSAKYEALATDKDGLSGMSSLTSYWNQPGLISSFATNSDYSWNDDTASYSGGGYAKITNFDNGTLDTVKHSDELTSEGHRKIRYIACDVANNCSTKALVVKIDRTAPTMYIDNLTKGNYAENKSYEYKHTNHAIDKYSGLILNENAKPRYFYNHCYDWYITETSERFCVNNTASDGKNKKLVSYSSYADRKYGTSGTNGLSEYIYSTDEHYQETNGLKEYVEDHHCDSSTKKCYYHLFYKLIDQAGNESYYRYKLWYGNNGEFRTLEKISEKIGNK